VGHLQAIADSVLAWVPVQRHHQSPAVLMSELEGDIADVQAAFHEHGRACVTQLVEIDRAVPERDPAGPDVAPEVCEGTLRAYPGRIL
jgi:hypothetical protein